MASMIAQLRRAHQSWSATIIAAFIVAIGTAAPTAAQQGQVCWTPQALRGNPTESAIVKNVAQARVIPPSEWRSVAAARTSGDFRPIRRVNLPATAPKLIALTFDLCEQPNEISGYQGPIVDYLRENAVRATFFSGGKWMLTHPERAQQLMADSLFEIGNHAWEHRNLRVINQETMRGEIGFAQKAFVQTRAKLEQRACFAPGGGLAHQRVPAEMTLFRFPYGACNPHALQEVGHAGLKSIQWDVSSGDPRQLQTADRMAQAVLKAVSPGSIVLFHANGRGWHTADALPRIIGQLREKGYKFVTVSELLAAPGAVPVYSETCYDFKLGDTDRYDGLASRLEKTYAQFAAMVGRPAPAATSEPPVLRVKPVLARPIPARPEPDKPSSSIQPAPESAPQSGPQAAPAAAPQLIAPPSRTPPPGWKTTTEPPKRKQPQPPARGSPFDNQ